MRQNVGYGKVLVFFIQRRLGDDLDVVLPLIQHLVVNCGVIDALTRGDLSPLTIDSCTFKDAFVSPWRLLFPPRFLLAGAVKSWYVCGRMEDWMWWATAPACMQVLYKSVTSDFPVMRYLAGQMEQGRKGTQVVFGVCERAGHSQKPPSVRQPHAQDSRPWPGSPIAVRTGVG